MDKKLTSVLVFLGVVLVFFAVVMFVLCFTPAPIRPMELMGR